MSACHNNCPRNFGIILVQVGSTISLVTNKTLDKIGFSALVKTPLGVFDCKVPQEKKSLDVKLFNTSPPLHYSLAFSPLYFTGIDIGLSKKIGPFYGKFSYDTGSSFTESLINVVNQAGNTQFFFQTQYSCIPQKAESKLNLNCLRMKLMDFHCNIFHKMILSFILGFTHTITMQQEYMVPIFLLLMNVA